MEPLLDKLARHKKQMAWFLLGILMAVFWFCLTGFIGLSEDDMRPHPVLDTVLDVTTFPASLLPGLESYDSRTAIMPMQVWQSYSAAGEILNTLLWGFFLVWLFRLVVRWFAILFKAPQTIILPPQRTLPGRLLYSSILPCVIILSMLLTLWAGGNLFFYSMNHNVIGINESVRSGNLERVKSALKNNPNLAFSKDNNGRTPLHWALMANGVGYDYTNMAELLLANGADVNASDPQGWTPLELAAENGYGDVAQLLIMHGARVDTKDSNGATPLDYASANGHMDVVQLLLTHGADVKATDKNGKTTLDWAAENGQQDVAQLLRAHGVAVNIYDAAALGYLDKLKALLDEHADLVFSKDYENRTPLLLAAATGQTNAVAMLLAYKADVHSRDDEGETPLHIAAFYDYVGVAELLLANKADVNARDNEDKTPLHKAVMWGHTDMVKLLLANKADINAKDQSGYTPLHYSENNEDKNVAEFLRQHGGHE
jgi:ankyrin repeat protein